MRFEIAAATTVTAATADTREIHEKETLPQETFMEIAVNTWFTAAASSLAWVLATFIVTQLFEA